jgi:hypothetical protein
MHIHPRAITPVIAAFALALGPLAAPAALAKIVHFDGSFAAEGSATTSPAGNVIGTLSTKTRHLTYTITYSGLSGPVTGAHFHGPAAAGQEAGVLLPIPGPYKTGMHGTLKASAAAEKAILDGEAYVNLHTAKYPMGEARAQIKSAS